MPNYGDAKYWDDRYKTQKTTTFDWLEGWEDVKDIIEKHCIVGLYSLDESSDPKKQQDAKQNQSNYREMQYMNHPLSPTNLVPVPDDQSMALKNKLEVLNLGCGNSIICEEMYDEGYLNIWNMDISQICIQQMIDRNHKTRPNMKWEVMDVRELKYPDGQFDLIVDKSTIDALLCGEQAYLNVAIMMKECQRVLKEGGYYVAISYGAPDNRSFHFKRAFLHMKLTTFQIRKPQYGTEPQTYHYVYVLRKLVNADSVCSKNWDQTYNQIKKELDDEASESVSSRSVPVAQTTIPKSTPIAKNEVSQTNEEQTSEQQESSKGQQTEEVDEKTYEEQQEKNLLSELATGGSSKQTQE